MAKEIKMKNEAEFVFDDVLNTGFTIIPNEIFDDERLTNNAVAVYCKIIRRRNIEGWKIYQSTLVNKKNGIDKIASAVKELVESGWLTKERLRNEKGHVKGMKYTVYSTSQIKVTSDVQPKLDFPKQDKPKQDKPKQDKPRLKINTNTNKEKKNKDNTNKDTTQYQQQVACSNPDEVIFSSFNQVEVIENNTHLLLSKNQRSKVLSWDIERLNKSIIIFKEQAGQYFAMLEKIYKDNRNFAPKAEPKTTKSKLSAPNFTQREYDYNKLENQLLGWEDEEEIEEVETATCSALDRIRAMNRENGSILE